MLIYDEAQRAFDAAQVKAKHPELPAEFREMSEPELFIRFAERIPEWCVVVGLIGSGQEIHIGEEAGIGQWRFAIEASAQAKTWSVFAPSMSAVRSAFDGMARLNLTSELELSQTICFHLATQLDKFVESLLAGDVTMAAATSAELERNDFNLRLTDDLALAKQYLRGSYAANADARYGMLASAKDKDLPRYGIPKGFKSPGEVGPGKYGRWYAEGTGPGSCCDMRSVVTEFGAQGLELDGALLAWGTDFIRLHGSWTNQFASRYREPDRIKDAKGLRLNAYRVLLTRGRDCCVVFVPPDRGKMHETYEYLVTCGFTELKTFE